MQDFVSRKIAGIGWIAADTSRIIATGTEESEILDTLQEYLGYPVPRLEESPIEAFEATLRLAVANSLIGNQELLASLTAQLAAGQSDSIELKDVVGLLSQQVRSLSERNAALEREQRKAKRQAELTAFLEAEGFGPRDVPLMLHAMLAKEGLL